jgi:hypothetical protein
MQVSQKRDCWFCEGDMLFFQHFHTVSYFLNFFVRFGHFFRFCEGDLELNLSKTFILSNFWAIWVISNVAVLLPDPLRSRKFCRGSEAISDRISPFLKGGVWKLPYEHSNYVPWACFDTFYGWRRSFPLPSNPSVAITNPTLRVPDPMAMRFLSELGFLLNFSKFKQLWMWPTPLKSCFMRIPL